MAKPLPDIAERYWQLMLEGDADTIVGVFEGGEPRIDAPHPGTVLGGKDVRRFVAETRDWLRGMDAHVSPVRTTRGERRSVAEQDLHLRVGGRSVHLPTAVVAESGDSHALTRLTLYHSRRPLTGSHEVRPPVLETDPDLALPDVVGRYQAAMAQGNLQGVMDCFDPDAVLREPSGPPFVYRGEEALREYHLTALGNVGGIVRDYCTVTDDGYAVALEYNLLKWGRTVLLAQAGIAVYERDADDLVLTAVRVYDDVAPPMEEEFALQTAAHGAAGEPTE